MREQSTSTVYPIHLWRLRFWHRLTTSDKHRSCCLQSPTRNENGFRSSHLLLLSAIIIYLPLRYPRVPRPIRFTCDVIQVYTCLMVAVQEMRPLESRVSQIVIFQDRVYTAGANRILKPPSFSKYLSWGFSDRSVRIISYEQEKLLSTHENLHDDGTVLCAGFSRDGRILVTGNCIKHYIKVTLLKFYRSTLCCFPLCMIK